MDVRDWRFFLLLARELNFTRAAARGFVSQQALSARIKGLEVEVGFPLFSRTTRRVELTREGAELVSPVEEALALLDGALMRVRAGADGSRRRLRIGFNLYAAGELTPCILDAFREAIPDATVELHEIKHGSVLSGVHEGEIDLAFVRLPSYTEGLAVLEVFSEPIVMMVSHRHPLADRPVVTLEEALAQPVVMTRDADPGFSDFWLLSAYRDHPPRVGAVADTILEELELVAANEACSFAPAMIARYQTHSGVRFVPIVAGPRSSLALTWHPVRLSDAARAFIETVRHVMDSRSDVVAAMEAGQAPRTASTIPTPSL